MGATLRTHRAGAVAVALTALAFVVTGCGGNPANAPAGPTEPALKQSPTPTASPGATSSSSVHAGAASEDVVTAVTTALTAQGYKIASPSGVRVTYAGDAEHVTVSGGGITTAKGGIVQQIELQQIGGKWQVLNVSGQQ